METFLFHEATFDTGKVLLNFAESPSQVLRISLGCSGTTLAAALPGICCSNSRVIQAHSGRSSIASTVDSLYSRDRKSR